jgi:hypothetical protein
MKGKIMLTLAILGFAGWWAWRKYVLLQNVKIDVGSVNFDGGLLNPNIKINIIVSNPTQIEARVTALDGYILDSKKNKIGILSINGIYSIDAGSSIIIPLNIQTNTSNILNTVADYFYNKMENFYISGYATVDGIPVPYHFNINV